MRKYYIEVESYEDDSLIIGLRVVDQRTKNRREKFAKTLKNVRIDFYMIDRNVHSRLSLCQELNITSTKLMIITNRELRANSLRKEKKIRR